MERLSKPMENFLIAVNNARSNTLQGIAEQLGWSSASEFISSTVEWLQKRGYVSDSLELTDMGRAYLITFASEIAYEEEPHVVRKPAESEEDISDLYRRLRSHNIIRDGG